tara:strand:- start:91 stop:561 length:471 start_codon:yes stop_codon:yes gene_type:complete
MAAKILLKLAERFKKAIRDEYKETLSPEDAAVRKRLGQISAKEKLNKSFSYVGNAKTPNDARSRANEMFSDFDVDGAIEDAGGLEKAFKISPVKKSTPPFKDKAVRDQWQGGGDSMGDKKDLKAVKILEERKAAMVKPPFKKAKGGMVTKWQTKWG